MTVQHSAITDPDIHEPKGAASASADTVYVADGAGSGSWTSIDMDVLDTSALDTYIQGELDSGDYTVTGSYFVTVVIPDISTAQSVIIPVIQNSTVVAATVVLGGVIADADADISFTNSAAASMGTAVTVGYDGSAKGDQYAFTATGNNTITAPDWIEVATDGASTNTVPVYITLELTAELNT